MIWGTTLIRGQREEVKGEGEVINANVYYGSDGVGLCRYRSADDDDMPFAGQNPHFWGSWTTVSLGENWSRWSRS